MDTLAILYSNPGFGKDHFDFINDRLATLGSITNIKHVAVQIPTDQSIPAGTYKAPESIRWHVKRMDDHRAFIEELKRKTKPEWIIRPYTLSIQPFFDKNTIQKVLKTAIEQKNRASRLTDDIIFPSSFLEVFPSDLFAKSEGMSPVEPFSWPNSIELKSIGLDENDYRTYLIDQFNQHHGFPRSFHIELTDRCNLNCPMCFCNADSSLSRKQELSLDIALALADEISQHGKSHHIWLNFGGEPLLYPHLEEVIAALKKGGNFVAFTTNGTLLNRERSRRLIDAGLNRIDISLDATEPETYQRMRPGGNLSTVEKNIEDFLKLRSKLDDHRPELYLKAVLTDQNIHEENLMLEKWGSMADGIIFSKLLDYDKAVYPEKFYPLPNRRLCMTPWNNMHISSSGDVFVCHTLFCRSGRVMGNIRKRSIKEIWNSQSLKKWRVAYLANAFGGDTLCGPCDLWMCHANLAPKISRANGILVQTWPCIKMVSREKQN